MVLFWGPVEHLEQHKNWRIPLLKSYDILWWYEVDKVMIWWCGAEVCRRLVWKLVCIKQEFKQAATLARQPRNAEISTNQARAQPADQSEAAFGPMCNFSASSAWTKWVHRERMQQLKFNAICQRFLNSKGQKQDLPSFCGYSEWMSYNWPCHILKKNYKFLWYIFPSYCIGHCNAIPKN